MTFALTKYSMLHVSEEIAMASIGDSSIEVDDT